MQSYNSKKSRHTHQRRDGTADVGWDCAIDVVELAACGKWKRDPFTGSDTGNCERIAAIAAIAAPAGHAAENAQFKLELDRTRSERDTLKNCHGPLPA